MRPLIFALCLVCFALLFGGCSKPWSNPNYSNKKVSDYQFDKDSTDCSVMASEQYPLSKDKQLPIYEACMEERGWIQHKQGDSYYFNSK